MEPLTVNKLKINSIPTKSRRFLTAFVLRARFMHQRQTNLRLRYTFLTNRTHIRLRTRILTRLMLYISVIQVVTPKQIPESVQIETKIFLITLPNTQTDT